MTASLIPPPPPVPLLPPPLACCVNFPSGNLTFRPFLIQKFRRPTCGKEEGRGRGGGGGGRREEGGGRRGEGGGRREQRVCLKTRQRRSGEQRARYHSQVCKAIVVANMECMRCGGGGLWDALLRFNFDFVRKEKQLYLFANTTTSRQRGRSNDTKAHLNPLGPLGFDLPTRAQRHVLP